MVITRVLMLTTVTVVTVTSLVTAMLTAMMIEMPT